VVKRPLPRMEGGRWLARIYRDPLAEQLSLTEALVRPEMEASLSGSAPIPG